VICREQHHRKSRARRVEHGLAGAALERSPAHTHDEFQRVRRAVHGEPAPRGALDTQRGGGAPIHGLIHGPIAPMSGVSHNG
jgi:hypothetical protein